jgi:cell division protein FtsB
MNKKKRNTGLIVFIAVLAVLTYGLLLRGDYSVFKYFQSRNENEMIKNDIDELKAKIVVQQEKNKKLENRDPFEMEKKAREKGMVKENETVFKYEIEKEN